MSRFTCDCCARTLPPEAFGCSGWCDDCASGDCSPWGRKGRGCPSRLVKLHADMAVIARGAAARGGTVRLAGGA